MLIDYPEVLEVKGKVKMVDKSWDVNSLINGLLFLICGYLKA
jgi:hypothetical protein